MIRPWLRIAVIALTMLSSYGPTAQENWVMKYIHADVVRKHRLQGDRLTLVDVREKDEFSSGHIAGSLNVPLVDLASEAQRIPKSGMLVVYCIHSAHRAPQAAAMLGKLGHSKIYIVEGGLVALQEAGFKLVTSDSSAEAKILPVTDRCKSDALPATGGREPPR